MKQIFIVILCVLSVISYAQHGNWSPVESAQLPPPVLKTFKEAHPSAAHVSWGMRYEGRKLMYHAIGNESEQDNTHFRTKINADGTLITRIYRIDPTKLNDKIKSSIETEKGQGWELTKAFHKYHKGVESYGLYFANKSDKHLHLKFDKDGNEVKREKKGKEHNKKHHLS